MNLKTKIKLEYDILRHSLSYSWLEFKTSVALYLACLLPARVQLWCFILVYGADGNGPGPDYKPKYEHFLVKHKIKGM